MNPEQDDQGPLSGLAWADDDTFPMCQKCGDSGWLTALLYDGTAMTKPCDYCFMGEEN